MEEERRGNTVAYKQQKLKLIQEELKQLQAQHPGLSRWYGVFDPLTETEHHINPCRCGATPMTMYAIPDITQQPGANNGTRKGKDSRRAWFVLCPGCTRNGEATRKEWQAILLWNRSRHCEAPDYRKLPVFNLQDLEPAEAKQRLRIIRRQLELRANEAGLRRDLGMTRTNQRYLERMKAFLQWCIYAQSLVGRGTEHGD